MGVSRKMVEFAVGALMFVGVVSVGFSYFNQAEDFSNTQKIKNSVLLEEKEEWFVTRYEGLSPSGADVVKYIKTNIDRVDKITVVTDKKTFIADESQYSSYSISSNDYYINPLKTYTIAIERNANGTITGVRITVNG
jgi:hypothetical protein